MRQDLDCESWFRAFSSRHSFTSIRTLLNGAGGIPALLLDSTRLLFPNAELFSAYGSISIMNINGKDFFSFRCHPSCLIM